MVLARQCHEPGAWYSCGQFAAFCDGPDEVEVPLVIVTPPSLTLLSVVDAKAATLRC